MAPLMEPNGALPGPGQDPHEFQMADWSHIDPNWVKHRSNISPASKKLGAGFTVQIANVVGCDLVCGPLWKALLGQHFLENTSVAHPSLSTYADTKLQSHSTTTLRNNNQYTYMSAPRSPETPCTTQCMLVRSAREKPRTLKPQEARLSAP